MVTRVKQRLVHKPKLAAQEQPDEKISVEAGYDIGFEETATKVSHSEKRVVKWRTDSNRAAIICARFYPIRMGPCRIQSMGLRSILKYIGGSYCADVRMLLRRPPAERFYAIVAHEIVSSKQLDVARFCWDQLKGFIPVLYFAIGATDCGRVTKGTRPLPTRSISCGVVSVLALSSTTWTRFEYVCAWTQSNVAADRAGRCRHP